MVEIPPDYPAGIIGGRIVGDHQFKRLVGLGENGIQLAGKKSCPIKGAQYNRNQWPFHIVKIIPPLQKKRLLYLRLTDCP